MRMRRNDRWCASSTQGLGGNSSGGAVAAVWQMLRGASGLRRYVEAQADPYAISIRPARCGATWNHLQLRPGPDLTNTVEVGWTIC